MTTAARLVAALCLTALGFLASEYVKTLMAESTNFGYFTYVNMLIGFLCGWIIVGARAGRGMSAAISHGITGTAALVFWGLFVQAANEMVRLSMRHRYDGFMEAIAAIFELMVDFGATLLDGGFFLMMIVGALVTGYLTEVASRHWR